MRAVVGLDLGTSTLKGVRVRTQDGRILATVTAPAPAAEPGWLDAEALLGVAETLLRRLMTPDVAAIGCSAAMHSLLLVDAEERPLGPASTWENRAVVIPPGGGGAGDWERTGMPWHPVSPAARWAYWRARGRLPPGSRPRAVKDWVLHRWTGRLTTDLATAAAGGFLNRTTRSWDAETLARLDLAPAALPALCPPGEVVGRWAGVPVVAGITDGAAPHWAWQLGPAGVTCSLGTSGAIRRLAVDRGQPVASRGLFAYAVDDRRSLIGGAVSDAGNLLAWWAGVTRCSVRRIVEEAVREPVPRDLAVAPFWFGARSPYWDDRRGSVGGLTGTVRRPQLSAALLYGALAVLGETGQALAAVTGSYDRLHASGGLLSHPDLARVAASALGAPLRVARGWDASALGAARLAAEAVADPGPWPLPWTDVDPDPGLVDAIHAWAGRAGMGDGGERA